MTEVALVIAVRELVKTYQLGKVEVNALQNVSFEIARGEFVAIMGPSGSGKSTLMNVLGCHDTPTRGSYQLDGVETARLQDEELAQIRAQKIGFVFRQHQLLPRQTALRNVEMPLIYRGMSAAERRQRAETALQIVAIGDWLDHRPNEMSGGEQQRVAIARARRESNCDSRGRADRRARHQDKRSDHGHLATLESRTEFDLIVVTGTAYLSRENAELPIQAVNRNLRFDLLRRNI